jgi:hypothetical protein
MTAEQEGPYKVGDSFESKGQKWVRISGEGWWANVPENEAGWAGNMNQAHEKAYAQGRASMEAELAHFKREAERYKKMLKGIPESWGFTPGGTPFYRCCGRDIYEKHRPDCWFLKIQEALKEKPL